MNDDMLLQIQKATFVAPFLVSMMKNKDRFTTNCFNSFNENSPIENSLGPEVRWDYASLQFIWNILRANNSVYCDKKSKQWLIDDTKKEITLTKTQIKNIYNSSVLGKKRTNHQRHLIVTDSNQVLGEETCKKIKLSENDDDDSDNEAQDPQILHDLEKGPEKSDEDVGQDHRETVPRKTFSLAVDHKVLTEKISRLELYTTTLKNELTQAHSLIETYESTFKNSLSFNQDVPRWTMSFQDFITKSLKLPELVSVLDMASMKIYAYKLLILFSRNNINVTNTDARKLFEVALCIKQISSQPQYYARYTAMLATKFIPHGALNTDIIAMYNFLDAKSASYMPEYEYIIPICLINQ